MVEFSFEGGDQMLIVLQYLTILQNMARIYYFLHFVGSKMSSYTCTCSIHSNTEHEADNLRQLPVIWPAVEILLQILYDIP